MKHRLTPVQKRVLRFMLDAPQPVVFETGHKTTAFSETFHVYCQSFIPYFLKHHGYIHEPNQYSCRWELTDKGIAAVAGCKKSPTGTHIIGTAGDCAFCKRKVARDLEATT